MKEIIAREINQLVDMPIDQIIALLEIPPSSSLGDFAFPCFNLAIEMRKNPSEIAGELALKLKSDKFEKVESRGPYINFFLNRKNIAEKTLTQILKEKDKYGSQNLGKKKVVVIDMSSPNIAKPFGVGHLRSTIIGNSLSKIGKFFGFKVIKLNYLGDWGTQFGKLVVGYKKFGSESKLKKNPINHLLDLYVKVSSDPNLEEESRKEFKSLEDGDKKNLALWSKFRKLSLLEFDRIYKILNIQFDAISGESYYNKKMDSTLSELNKKNLLKKSEGAQIIDLNSFGLGACLIKKSDGATLYATRDITAAIDRVNKYKADYLVYEVGSEQKLHFRQVFKVLELLGYKWADRCSHVDHGLYLDADGKKFSTRQGKTVLMIDILNETIEIAMKEISKREKLSKLELGRRALAIARAAIFYGDLKNFRSNDIVFDIQRFLDFEGNTGPYLLYTYARAKSILRKAKYKKFGKVKVLFLSDKEKALVLSLANFSEVVMQAYKDFAPNYIANYAYGIAKEFNEFYHSEKVIGSNNEKLKLSIVDAFSHVLKNALALLGIDVIEKM